MRSVLMIGVLGVFGCESDSGVKVFNSSPAADITSHDDPAAVKEATDERFYERMHLVEELDAMDEERLRAAILRRDQHMLEQGLALEAHELTISQQQMMMEFALGVLEAMPQSASVEAKARL